MFKTKDEVSLRVRIMNGAFNEVFEYALKSLVNLDNKSLKQSLLKTVQEKR